ncbi:MAG: enoyl-CoA hydratase-related protein [Candidatus Dormiibacterota bacterium]
MSDTGTDTVLLERHGALTWLILNRPSSLNSMNEEMATGIQRGLESVINDRACRCLGITGTGRAFCSGQALPDTDTADPLPPDIATLIRTRYVPIVSRIRSLSVPVVAAINGPAVGAGFSLALAADLRIAARGAWFSTGFAQLGLAPDSGATFFLTRYLGYPMALELYLTGRRLSALEAARAHLVTSTFPTDSFSGDAEDFCLNLAQGPTRAFALGKRSFVAALNSTLEEQLELEAVLQQDASETQDFHEGLRAFKEKRAPHFEGN